MLNFKAPGRLMQGSRAADWGAISRYVEVADDQRAVRQVDIFDNGNVLRYDRSHSWDAFGRPIGQKFSAKPKWAKFFPGTVMISEKHFERVWRSAQSSVLRELQLGGRRERCTINHANCPSWEMLMRDQDSVMQHGW